MTSVQHKLAEAKKDERKLEKACKKLDKKIMKLSLTIDADRGPTKMQQQALETLQMDRISLVQRRSELVERMDELQANNEEEQENFVNSLQRESWNKPPDTPVSTASAVVGSFFKKLW